MASATAPNKSDRRRNPYHLLFVGGRIDAMQNCASAGESGRFFIIYLMIRLKKPPIVVRASHIEAHLPDVIPCRQFNGSPRCEASVNPAVLKIVASPRLVHLENSEKRAALSGESAKPDNQPTSSNGTGGGQPTFRYLVRRLAP